MNFIFFLFLFFNFYFVVCDLFMQFKCSGHIGITVDDTYKACERFARLNVEFVKKPDDGKKKF